MTDSVIDADEVLDTISDAISDSIDLDWTPAQAAASVVASFEREGWSLARTAASTGGETDAHHILVEFANAIGDASPDKRAEYLAVFTDRINWLISEAAPSANHPS